MRVRYSAAITRGVFFLQDSTSSDTKSCRYQLPYDESDCILSQCYFQVYRCLINIFSCFCFLITWLHFPYYLLCIWLQYNWRSLPSFSPSNIFIQNHSRTKLQFSNGYFGHSLYNSRLKRITTKCNDSWLFQHFTEKGYLNEFIHAIKRPGTGCHHFGHNGK